MGDGDQIAFAEFFDGADCQAGKGWRIERADVDFAVADKVIGAAPVKGLLRIGHEEMRGTAAGSTGQIRAVFKDLVQLLTVIGGNVFNVTCVLVATFNLERAHARIYQVAQVGALVVVLHRQQVFFESDDTALIILERVGQAAGLRAVATVGATAVLRVGNVALPGKRHTQRTMNKELDGRIGLTSDFTNFLQVQLAGQHQLREAGLIEKLRPAQRTNIGLRAGVQFDGRNVQLHDPEVLHDQCIDARVVELMDQLAGGFQLVVMQDGVDRGENPRVVAVGEFHQFGDIADLVAGVVSRTKTRPADVNRVGAMQDGFTGDGHVPGRAEQFQVVLG
ncbi:hypothetical protein ALO76_102470 [Pseudomonas syringae pv. coriandricola]|nr:hypothetical protein ALO76_102470 [Pseudomonas syringae pv. coriandricola]